MDVYDCVASVSEGYVDRATVVVLLCRVVKSQVLGSWTLSFGVHRQHR